MDDREIVELYQKRNEDAIRATAEKYGRYLRYIVGNVLQDPRDREEVVFGVYEKLWDKIPPDAPENLKAYAAKIARQDAVDLLRRDGAKKRGSGFRESLEELSELFLEPSAPGDVAEETALRESVERFLRGLRSRDRVLFVRRYWYGATVRELSEAEHLGESRVKMILLRLRRKLQEHLEKEGFEG